MRTIASSALVLGLAVCAGTPAAAQPPAGARVIDGRAAGYEATSTAGARSASPAAQRQPATAEQENLFWQSIADSTDPADFEAYLEVFPNGVFRRLAENRLAALRSPGGGAPAPAGRPAGAPAPAAGRVDAPRRPGDVFRDCAECPEMVVLAGGGLAMGRYEVTVGEYRAFASAAGGGAGGGCLTVGDGDSWRDPGYPQTDRHPVTCVSWNDAQEYVAWLSRRTGATYRLPTAAEWERAAAGTPAGVGCGDRRLDEGACPVGSYGANAAGLSDMVGNLWEWTSDCSEGDCGYRVGRGGAWLGRPGDRRPGARVLDPAGLRVAYQGFRVSRTLD